EAGDGDRERVQVHAVDRVERGLDAGLDLDRGGVLVPAVQQTAKRTEQEVARAARRVDHPEALKRAFFQRRFQRAVQDMLFDEHRRLEQRIRVLRVFRQV